MTTTFTLEQGAAVDVSLAEHKDGVYVSTFTDGSTVVKNIVLVSSHRKADVRADESKPFSVSPSHKIKHLRLTNHSSSQPITHTIEHLKVSLKDKKDVGTGS